MPVGEGWLSIPRAGRAVAEVRLAVSGSGQPVKEGQAVTIELQGGHSFKLTAIYAGIELGLWRVRLVGGSGKLDTMLRPRFYRGIAARAVLADLIEEAGEKAGQLDAPGVFSHYVRMAEPARLALGTALHAQYPGHVWRIGPDGLLNVIQDSWPDSGLALDVLEEYPAERRALCRPLPGLHPGTLASGRKIDRVRHAFSGQRITTEVGYV